MDYAALGAYFMALAALTAAPGPVVAVLVARSLGRDTRGATAFAAGLCFGDLLAVCAVTMGVGAWAESRPEWFAMAKYMGVAYLLWLAYQMWNDSSTFMSAQPRKGGWLASTGAGVALCLGNPSTVLIYMLLLPAVAPTGIHGVENMALLVLVTFAAVGAVFFGAILLARQVQRVITSPESSGMVNRIMGGTVALTAVWILAV